MRQRLIALPVMMAIACSLLLLLASSAHAWIRPLYEDAVLVERSELIVVARVKEGTIRHVGRKNKPGRRGSYEHHVTLVVSRVIKGEFVGVELPIVIHYGLTPVVGGYAKGDNFEINLRGVDKNYPPEIIELFDTGGIRGSLALGDLREDKLWFLRKRTGTFGEMPSDEKVSTEDPGAGKYGIVDPLDVQLYSWLDYFQAYQRDDPEAAIRAWQKENPDLTASDQKPSAKRFLDHLEIQRILQIEETDVRYQRLLPYYLANATWNIKFEARDGIIACGELAAERLIDVFRDPEQASHRSDIARLWSQMRYREALPILIAALEKHDLFWAEQDLRKNDRNADLESLKAEQDRHRNEVSSEVYSIVIALRGIGDQQAVPILERTRERWRQIHGPKSQIGEECETVLGMIADRMSAEK